MGPLVRALGQAMFDGIVMNVVEMVSEYLVMVDYLLPEATLPYIAFAVFLARPGNVGGAMIYASK